MSICVLNTILIIGCIFSLYKSKGDNDLHPFDSNFSTAVKGLMALLIVLHHLSEYSPGTHLLVFYDWGFSIVAVFFFISGYGVMKSWIVKGDAYKHHFLQRRLKKILPMFIILTIVAIALKFFVNDQSLNDILVAFSHGTMPLPFSWYIYAVIFFYVAFYISIKISRRKDSVIGMMLGFVTIYIYLLRLMSFGCEWYFTVPSILVGLIIAAYESQVCNFIKRHKLTCFAIIIAVLIAPIITSNSGALILGYNTAPIVILMFAYTNKMSTPKFLTILGGISLEIYLVHGLFVIEYAKLISNAWFYEIMVCASTLIFAYILNKLNRSINN